MSKHKKKTKKLKRKRTRPDYHNDFEDFSMVTEKLVKINCEKEKEIATTEAFTAHAVLNLVAPEIENFEGENSKRPKLAVTAVLDRSGSMNGAKLNLTKTAMHFITEQLKEDDMFGIITYDDNVTTEFDLVYAGAQNKVAIAEKINRIFVGGCTNLSGGLEAGIQQQILSQQNNMMANQDTIRAVLLCTDGLANVGITNTQSLSQITRNYVNDQQNLRVHTFGFGRDHDPHMLTQIAEAGQGDFFFVEGDDAIPQAFGNVLGGLLSVGAQNVRVVITPIDPTFRVVKVWDKVIDQQQDANGVLTMQLRDLKSEVPRKILFQYSVEKTDQQGIQNLAKINVNYFNVATENNETISYTLSINRQIFVPQDTPTNSEVASNMARIQAAFVIEQATSTAEHGDLNGARIVIQKGKQDLQNLNLSDKVYQQQLWEDLQQLEFGFQDQSKYQKQGRQFGFALNFGAACQSSVFQAFQPDSLQEGSAEPKMGGQQVTFGQGFNQQSRQQVIFQSKAQKYAEGQNINQ